MSSLTKTVIQLSHYLCSTHLSLTLCPLFTLSISYWWLSSQYCRPQCFGTIDPCRFPYVWGCPSRISHLFCVFRSMDCESEIVNTFVNTFVTDVPNYCLSATMTISISILMMEIVRCAPLCSLLTFTHSPWEAHPVQQHFGKVVYCRYRWEFGGSDRRKIACPRKKQTNKQATMADWRARTEENIDPK